MAPSIVDPHGAADNPSCFLQPLMKRRHASLYLWIVRGHARQHANPSYALLRSRRERPRCGRAADERDDLASFHACCPKSEDCTLPHRCKKCRVCASQQILAANVRVGSRAAVRATLALSPLCPPKRKSEASFVTSELCH